MNINTFLLLGTVLCLGTTLIVFFLQYIAHFENLWWSNHTRFGSVSVHTYKPPHGVIPKRGILVLTAGWKYAESNKCPLILSVGKTTPGTSTEAEIYRDYAYKKFGNSVTIIIGEDPNVRETAGEVAETLKRCREINSQTHLIVALAPHVARVRMIWRKCLGNNLFSPQNSPRIYFLPVKGPWRYWVWEALMLCLHFLAPPGSRQQNLLLDIIGRKG